MRAMRDRNFCLFQQASGSLKTCVDVIRSNNLKESTDQIASLKTDRSSELAAAIAESEKLDLEIAKLVNSRVVDAMQVEEEDGAL